MSPHKVITAVEAAHQHEFPNTNLHIMGLSCNYPEHTVAPKDLRDLAYRRYPRTPAMEKMLAVNDNTGIETRSTICSLDHPIIDGAESATIDQLSAIFLTEGVQLAAGAARKAIEEWGGDVSEITHLVATTCTNSANPGYDYYVACELGLSGTVERTLLHGVGCAGGLTALRTAANIALGASFLNKPARILVVACELSSLMARSEMDSIIEGQDLRIGVTIFSDGASAVMLSNGIGEAPDVKPVFDLLGWDHRTIPETAKDIGFDVHPNGWKVILTPRVPALASTSTLPILTSLLPRIVSLRTPDGEVPRPVDFDWCLHPGGAKVLMSVQKLLGLSTHHLRASYDVYKHHGNSSSATIFSVMNRLRAPDMGPGKEHVVSCAFGPGVSVEMCILKRRNTGMPVMMERMDSTSSSDSE